MERKKVVAVIPKRQGISQRCYAVFAREILHFVQDDRTYRVVMHGVVLKWNEKK